MVVGSTVWCWQASSHAFDLESAIEDWPRAWAATPMFAETRTAPGMIFSLDRIFDSAREQGTMVRASTAWRRSSHAGERTARGSLANAPGPGFVERGAAQKVRKHGVTIAHDARTIDAHSIFGPCAGRPFTDRSARRATSPHSPRGSTPPPTNCWCCCSGSTTRSGWNSGFLSCAHWLHWRTGIDLGAAREKVRVARALPGLPRLSAAMQRGAISYAKVRAITRVATPGERVPSCWTWPSTATAAQVERVVRAWRRVRSRGRRPGRPTSRHLASWAARPMSTTTGCWWCTAA